jgi:hypothetical protein
MLPPNLCQIPKILAELVKLPLKCTLGRQDNALKKLEFSVQALPVGQVAVKRSDSFLPLSAASGGRAKRMQPNKGGLSAGLSAWANCAARLNAHASDPQLKTGVLKTTWRCPSL